MSTEPRSLAPYGLKILLGGLRQAMVAAQPPDITHYASFYFLELLRYRHENPSMDLKDLVQEFKRRQENVQIRFDSPTSGTSESEIGETDKGECPADHDPRVSDASLAEVIPALLDAALKYPELYSYTSDPLVGVHSMYPADSPTSGIPESEIVETEKGERPADQDPSVGDASQAEALPALLDAALKYPELYNDTSDPLVGAHSMFPADRPTSGIPESEKEETENVVCPADQDPRVGDASLLEALPALLDEAIKYPVPYGDTSDALVGAHSVNSQLQPTEEASGAAGAEYKDSVMYQQQEQSSGVETSAEQSAEEHESLDKVSSETLPQPTKTMKEKASVNGAVPKRTSDQAVYPTTRETDPDGQNTLPRDVPSNGKQNAGATHSSSAFFPVRTISKPQNAVNLPGDVQRIVSSTSKYLPDQVHSSASGSSIYVAKKTVESRLPEIVPPTHGVAQQKRTSPGDQQRATEMPSPNRYQINISVDKPVKGVYYEPAYIPGKEASMVHIVTAVPTSRTASTMVSADTTSVHCKSTPKPIPCENIKNPTVHCRHPSQDLVQRKSACVKSQTGCNQRCSCQRRSRQCRQQATCRKTERSKYCANCVLKKSSSSEGVNKRGYSDTSTQMSPSEITQACSCSVQQNLMDNPGVNRHASQRTFYQHCNFRQADQSVNSQCGIEPLQCQTPKSTKFLICPCMSDLQPSSVQPLLITSPVHVVADESKQVASFPPYILVGSSEWRRAHAVRSRNEQDFQRLRISGPFASTKPNPGNQMQDLSFQHGPMYISVAFPVEEVQGKSATPLNIHLADAKSVIDRLDQKQSSRAKTTQD